METQKDNVPGLTTTHLFGGQPLSGIVSETSMNEVDQVVVEGIQLALKLFPPLMF